MHGFSSLLARFAGEFVVARHDPRSGAFVFIAIHSTRLGPASGGTRWRTYERPEDALEDSMLLAEAMSRKMAILGLPRGGGKGVIAAPADLGEKEREGVLERYGALIESLRGAYGTGPDFGTSSADMDVIRRKTAHVAGCSPARGGSGSSAPLTALGVFHGIRAAVERALGGSSLGGRKVLVQGVGAVGGALVSLLAEDGAEVVATDADPERLEEFRAKGIATVAPGDAFDAACDVFAPCAVGGILDEATIPRLRCRVVAGAANNPLASEDGARRLASRGILYAPDYVINAGGAIALVGLEQIGWSRDEVVRRVVGIGDTLRAIFDRARERGVTPAEAAEAIALERLAG